MCPLVCYDDVVSCCFLSFSTANYRAYRYLYLKGLAFLIALRATRFAVCGVQWGYQKQLHGFHFIPDFNRQGIRNNIILSGQNMYFRNIFRNIFNHFKERIDEPTPTKLLRSNAIILSLKSFCVKKNPCLQLCMDLIDG